MYRSIITTTSTALLLIALLVYFTRRFIFKPLKHIESAIKQRESNGIPRSHLPSFSYREITTLSETINNMLDVIRQSNASLQREHTRLQNVIDGTRAGTWEWNIQTGAIYVNERWAEILGYSLSEISARLENSWFDFIHPDDRKQSDDIFAKLLSKEMDFYACEIRLQHKNGGWVWVMGRGKVVEWTEGGQPKIMSGTHLDITERKTAEGNLRLAAKVFVHAREGIIITDPNRHIIDVNDAFSRITGYTRDEVMGETPRLLQSGRHSKAFYDAMWLELRNKGYWSGEVWNQRRSGEQYPQLLTISTTLDDDQNIQNYIAVFADISAIKEHEQQLKQLAHFDSLTGLPNRFLLGDRLQRALVRAKRQGQCVAVLFLDLDGFKAINDQFGHGAGDQLLKSVAKRMQNALRETDTIARLGGDEFVAILPDLDTPNTCLPIFPRLLSAVSKAIKLDDQYLHISASFGVTFYPQEEDVDADQLLRQADQAMYIAKLKGKDGYHIFDQLHDRSLRSQHETLHNIQRAFSNREFVLYYQPKVNLRTGEIIGAEALIRWQHPERGLLEPENFLPYIEGHPLIIELGDWTLHQSLAQITEWQNQGIDLPVSVNIAPFHLMQTDFTERLRNILALYPSVSPDRLELEVLETSALEDIVHVSQVIDECQQLGTSFAIDDFGTGYSSLTYLKQLSARVLKIDRSFVHDMVGDPEDLAILASITNLADIFHRKVIAEGVENHEQGELLLWLGCDLAQGYGIAHPMPPQELPRWRETWSPDLRLLNSKTMEKGLLPALFAMVEYRARLASLKAYVQNQQPRPLSAEFSPFNQRLMVQSESSRQKKQEAFISLHKKALGLDAEILSLKADGEDDSALVKLGELQDLNASQWEELRLLIN